MSMFLLDQKREMFLLWFSGGSVWRFNGGYDRWFRHVGFIMVQWWLQSVFSIGSFYRRWFVVPYSGSVRRIFLWWFGDNDYFVAFALDGWLCSEVIW